MNSRSTEYDASNNFRRLRVDSDSGKTNTQYSHFPKTFRLLNSLLNSLAQVI